MQITPSDLVGMKFKLPGDRSAGKSLGKLSKHSSSFSMYRVPEQTEETDENMMCGGQEMTGFRCLVPYMKRKGKLGFGELQWTTKPLTNCLMLVERLCSGFYKFHLTDPFNLIFVY
jgi:hypothetical protein